MIIISMSTNWNRGDGKLDYGLDGNVRYTKLMFRDFILVLRYFYYRITSIILVVLMLHYALPLI